MKYRKKNMNGCMGDYSVRLQASEQCHFVEAVQYREYKRSIATELTGAGRHDQYIPASFRWATAWPCRDMCTLDHDRKLLETS